METDRVNFVVTDNTTGLCVAECEADDPSEALEMLAGDHNYASDMATYRPGELSVWSLTREGVVRWTNGPGGAEMIVADSDVPPEVREALDLDMPPEVDRERVRR